MSNQNNNNLDNNNNTLNNDNSSALQCSIINNNSELDFNNEHLNDNDTTDIVNYKTLTFATHNVHGLNNNIKNKQIIDTFTLQ